MLVPLLMVAAPALATAAASERIMLDFLCMLQRPVNPDHWTA